MVQMNLRSPFIISQSEIEEILHILHTDLSITILRKPSQDLLINKTDLWLCLSVFTSMMALNTLHFDSGSRLYICFCN